MSFNQLNLNDMVQALSQLTGSMISFKENGQNSVDFSPITPTIIAIGDIPDSKVDELLKLTNNDPVVIWNLGSRPLSPLVKASFRQQVIDANWRTPSQYTRAPMLPTIFSLCHSIKSWYDLNDRNLTLIHCPAGHPNTGILVACLLKYIGAFEHASHAHDFYSSKRLKCDPIHTLAPSYSNLFVNVDKIIERNGYLNDEPLYLKTITISGLNLEDAPCFEIWDGSGLRYSSHIGFHADSTSCSWNSESGDGFFKISQYIVGDFSVVCRFGGHLAATKDKSTLIFKYQNTTAFLVDEVVDLRHSDVDLNPQYTDSIDLELLAVHLMFESNPSLIGLQNNVNSAELNARKQALLPPYPKMGIEAFEAGLDEISKYHCVVPDPKIFSVLVQKGYEEKYVLVALQLSNNRIIEAEKLVLDMRKRAKELLQPTPPITLVQNTSNEALSIETRSNNKPSPTENDLQCWEVVDLAQCPVCNRSHSELEDQLILCSQCTAQFHTLCVGARRIPFSNKTEKDRESRERYVRRHYGQWVCPTCTSKKHQEQNILEQDSGFVVNDNHMNPKGGSMTSGLNMSHVLSSPSSRASYAVSTAGGGVVVTDKIRTVTNATGQPCPSLTSPGGMNGNKINAGFMSPMKGSVSSSSLSVADTPSTSSLHQHPMSPNVRSSHDQMALLVGLLSSSNIGMEELITMPPAKQKETVLNIIHKKYPGYSMEVSQEISGSLDLVQAMRGIISNAKQDSKLDNKNANGASDSGSNKQVSADRYFGGQLTEEQEKQQLKTKEKESVSFDPRAHMMSIIMRRGETAAAEKSLVEKQRLEGVSLTSTGYRYDNAMHGGGSNNSTGGTVSLSSMYSNQINFSAVGGFGSNSQGKYNNNTNNNGIGSANDAGEAPSGPPVTLSLSSGVASTKVKDIPEYSKYFKMLKAGIDKDLVAEKAVADGVLSDATTAKRLFQSDPDQPLSPVLYQQLNAFVSVASHPAFEKFFKMLKVGLDKSQIKSQMREEGVDPTVLDKDPLEKLSLAAFMQNTQQMSQGGNNGSGSDNAVINDGMVTLEDHPHYSKFFKMIKVGMSVDTVKTRMSQEGFDPSLLDKSPIERVLPPTGNQPRKIPISEHRVYSKYYKMVKVGLPKETVQAKMREEGLNAALLDKDPSDLVEDIADDDGGDDMGGVGGVGGGRAPVLVALCMHPKYAKYFKMLSLGMPIDAVKEKMKQENANPDILDRDPNEMVSRSDDFSGKTKVPLSEHPLYAKYFKMLKVGLSKEAIKLKMEQENIDPSILEKDPAEKVTIEEKEDKKENDKEKEEEMVAVSEHPKYAKYFKMLKVGLPKDAVKAKMQQENVNPDILEKDPKEMIPLNDEKPKEAVIEKVPISEHPKYAKYFKMLKVGLPPGAVKVKMQQEGVNPDMIDKDPADLIPLNEDSPADKEAEEDEGPKVPVSEHPKYSKYFKMLKVGLPPGAVKAKMQQEGVNPDMLDKDPAELIPVDEEKVKKAAKKVEMVAVSEHPQYAKYFKMLKVGLPKPAVKAKMQQEGVNPDMLDKEPTDLIPLSDESAEDEGPKVPVSEHPQYTKFFKMLKVGLPLDAVKAKVKQEGLDPTMLDKEPTELVPLNPSSADAAAAKVSLPVKPKPKRKKLHWKAFDGSKIDKNSLWAEEQEIDLELDEEEFKKLFVESNVEEGAKKKAVVAKPVKEVKKQVVLIDMKRAQNGGIALARIKFTFDELKEKILNMSDENLTPDQLKSMKEYLPNSEELGPLRAYAGERDALGIAERYMLVMSQFPLAANHITIMLYKQQFKTRYIECRSKITKLQDACDDVRLSARLKKVLKTILKVGNQLNDGEENKGFTVDSLLKLHSAKALDKKTTILQYVVMLIFRNDEDSLKFPEDLKHVSEASRITMETIVAEKNGLQTEFEANFKMLEDIREKNPESNTNSMLDFFVKADSHCKELEKGYEKAKEKFAGVLLYFGEDANMAPHEFFTTLSKFISDFVSVRDIIDKARKAEQKKREQQLAQEALTNSNSNNNTANNAGTNKTMLVDKETTLQQRRAMRRHTMMPTQKNNSNANTPTNGPGDDSHVFNFKNVSDTSAGAGSEKAAAVTALQSDETHASERRAVAPERGVAHMLKNAAVAANDSQPPPVHAPVATTLTAATAAAASLPSHSSADANEMNPSENETIIESVSLPPPAPLNFSDPNDRAALLKEALAKKALSRRKSSIM